LKEQFGLAVLDFSIPVLKYRRQKDMDEDLGMGIQYSYIEDNHLIKTEGASVR